jgi:hypothetical protein
MACSCNVFQQEKLVLLIISEVKSTKHKVIKRYENMHNSNIGHYEDNSGLNQDKTSTAVW